MRFTKSPLALEQQHDLPRRRREPLIRHFNARYDEPLPPIWAAVEIMTLGHITKWYANLRHRPRALASSLDRDDGRRIYNTLTALAWLMDCTSPDHSWKLRLRELLERHRIDTRPMGFPADFMAMPIWAAVWGKAG
jgi:abortive infection bacteriophage resistance protein